MRQFARMVLPVILIALVALAGGCAGPTQQERAQLKYFQKSYQRTVSTDRYAVAPPDVITIHAALAPEVNNVKQQIAPDGTLNLDLLNRVYVAGMSPPEIEKLLAEKLRTYYKDVKVGVDVDYRSQWYYVFGQTDHSGPKRYTGRDTLVGALAEAQPTQLGWPERIYVIKPSADPDQRHVTVVNLKEIIQQGDSTANVLLEQDDIVYVPYNPLAAIGVSVQNLLFPVQPVVQAAGSASALSYGAGF
ncbi:MAG TPA: polysaccharide biosynthesis/export family protein [Phycisphaerae bacterium]|nr:polysaccharide biosynthesis/export family protein [Phycisphaerae bacterium]